MAVLPGKLDRLRSRDLAYNEVPGRGRQRRRQRQNGPRPGNAGHPRLRGKVLNTWEVERDLLFKNNEVHDIAVAIGVDPHGPNDHPI